MLDRFIADCHQKMIEIEKFTRPHFEERLLSARSKFIEKYHQCFASEVSEIVLLKEELFCLQKRQDLLNEVFEDNYTFDRDHLISIMNFNQSRIARVKAELNDLSSKKNYCTIHKSCKIIQNLDHVDFVLHDFLWKTNILMKFLNNYGL